jgi:hypothetical protein
MSGAQWYIIKAVSASQANLLLGLTPVRLHSVASLAISCLDTGNAVKSSMWIHRFSNRFLPSIQMSHAFFAILGLAFYQAMPLFLQWHIGRECHQTCSRKEEMFGWKFWHYFPRNRRDVHEIQLEVQSCKPSRMQDLRMKCLWF